MPMREWKDFSYINLFVYLPWVTGESCTDPVITPSAYTTSDAVISSESVFIVELSLTCGNGAQVCSQSQAAPTSGLTSP